MGIKDSDILVIARNRSRPVRYTNGASDDSDRPNKKMKMKKIKVTPKKKVDEYTPPYLGDLDLLLLHLYLLVREVGVGVVGGTVRNQTTTAYVTWHRQDSLLYGTFVEPTLVPLVSLTTTSKALWDTLATTTTVTATIAHPQRNQSRPVRYVNDASDDFECPNKKMKRMIKVTPKKKLQIEATLVGYSSHLSPPPTITHNQTTTSYVTWHHQDRPLYGTLVEPTIVPLVALTTTSKALRDTLATTTIVTPIIGDLDHPLHLLVGVIGVIRGIVHVVNRPTLITLRADAAKKRKKFYDIKQELYSYSSGIGLIRLLHFRMESDFYKNCFMACKLVFQALCAPGLSRQVNGVQKGKADMIIFRPPQRNRSRPVRYANGASDDSDRPNKKMKMKKIKVTPKKKGGWSRIRRRRRSRSEQADSDYAAGGRCKKEKKRFI
nr:hypothetical protein [Tanacetum cinerariifolium]